jgi:hypothetical protein
VGTASAHGVRVSGSVEGANGASFALSKTSRDDMVPARTEVIDGRLVLPAPLRDGTLVTLSATVAANGCEPTVVRRVLAVRSLPSFSRDTSRIGFGDDAPMRPNAVRSLTITIANEGTDRADDLRVYLTLPPWLRCADRAEDAAAVVVPSLAAGERFETDLDVAASADAPPGTFAVLAELAWYGGSFALDALTGVVETHAAFGDATLEADAATRESDDTIAYRLSLTNTGDGACRVLRIRTELGGPATYARGSFTVNGRRVRDVGNTSVAFGEGVVVEDVPVGAAIVCTWRCCVDTDIATAAVVECRATLAWDAEGSSVVEAPAVAVVPSRAFPTVAAALPARVPHAAIALATPISDALSPAAAVVAYDRSERARLRCDYLEGTVAASGLVAVLDLRIFLPFAADEVRERDDAARIAIRAFVRAVDRTAIGMRLGVALLRSDAVVSDDVRAAFGRYRSDLRDAPLGTVLLSVIDEFTSLENGAEAFEALQAYRTALRGLVAWWCSREDEIADLLAAEMPVAVATVRAAAIDALTRHLDRAVA